MILQRTPSHALLEKQLADIPVYSVARDLIDHKVERESAHNFKVTFDYPDCTRTFDGRSWTVQARPQPSNIFNAQ